MTSNEMASIIKVANSNDGNKQFASGKKEQQTKRLEYETLGKTTQSYKYMQEAYAMEL